MERPDERDSAFLRASAAIVVLRGTVAGKEPLSERYQIKPQDTNCNQETACSLLAELRKPVVCVSSANHDALTIECRSIEDFFTLLPEDRQKLELARREMIGTVKQHFQALSSSEVEDWDVTIAAAHREVRLDFDNYLRWLSEYWFSEGAVTEEPRVDAKNNSANMILRFGPQSSTRPNVEFVVAPRRS